MIKKVSLVLIFILPLGFYLANSYFQKEKFIRFSLESLQLCQKHSKELNLPSEICSQINSAAYEAYSSSISFYNPIIVLLIAINFALAFALFNLGNRLEKLEKKIND